MGFQRRVEISNPSPYERSDYVQVDLDKIGVPKTLNEENLMLYRMKPDGSKEPVPFQIDYPLGEKIGLRVISFLSDKTPKGMDDYSEESASFQLAESQKPLGSSPPGLAAECHLIEPGSGGKSGTFSKDWKKKSGLILNGVKLSNGSLDVYFKLSPAGKSPKGLSYSGSASSVCMPEVGLFTGCDEMLYPFWENPEKLWGQLNKLIFYKCPWEEQWFETIDLSQMGYDIVWMRGGPIRAAASLKSEPFTVTFAGKPFFREDKVEVKASLYRLIYLYPGIDRRYYTEELFVLAEKDNKYLSFRPYYFSKVPPEGMINEIKRFDHIPDYFSLWKHFGPLHRGYGFASDVHTDDVAINGDEIIWHLYLSPNFRCIHYFMFEPNEKFDPFHKIGHNGWYEQTFKPLRPKDLKTCFPPVVNHED